MFAIHLLIREVERSKIAGNTPARNSLEVVSKFVVAAVCDRRRITIPRYSALIERRYRAKTTFEIAPDYSPTASKAGSKSIRSLPLLGCGLMTSRRIFFRR